MIQAKDCVTLEDFERLVKHGPEAYHDKAVYVPICPTGDNEVLCTFERLILHHTRDGVTLKWLNDGVISSGWVIGLSKRACLAAEK